jgi:hypothetical protein
MARRHLIGICVVVPFFQLDFLTSTTALDQVNKRSEYLSRRLDLI